MTLYKYDLADEHAPDIPVTMVSDELICVWNGSISYGTASYDGSGIITMDLPDAVIKRLGHDLLRIEPRFRKVGTLGQPDTGYAGDHPYRDRAVPGKFGRSLTSPVHGPTIK